MSEIIVHCDKVHHWFGSAGVLYDVNVRVARGNIVAVVGPSGCGKSTLLRAIVGTHPPRQGRIQMHAHGKPPYEVRRPGRDRGIVYQRYSLFPFLTARENVAIGLMLDETSIPFRLFRFLQWRRIRRRHLDAAAAFLERVGLEHAVKLYPHEMSGGMCQRVAVAQALIMKPQILLLDEPFGALDEAMREELQRMLLRLHAENRVAKKAGEPPPHTILIVTHELNEAIYVGDRVIGLSQYWNWAEKGHVACPGATVVYDEAAPVSDPDGPRDFEEFTKQRDRIRKAVFEPEYLQDREEFRRYWTACAAEAPHRE